MWLPQDNLICTFPKDGDWSKPLDKREWDGPEMGPYHTLKFVDVPGEPLLGNPPLGLIRDLHEIANTIYMKLAKRGQLSKHVLGVTGRNVRDGEKLRDAQDMEIITMDNAGGIHESMYGSPDPALFGMVTDAVSQGKILAGNLDMLGGLMPQSETLGQDRLLSQNASKRMAAMQDRVMEWTKEIVSDIAFYVWDDAREFPVTIPLPGTNDTITYGWGPEHREGDFWQYNFDISPYSMVQQTPSEKLAGIMNIFNTIIMPMAQSGQLAARGKMVDVDGFLDIVGQYSGLKGELSRLLVDTTPQELPEQPMGKPSSPVMTKVNHRTSGSMAGRTKDQITQLMGGRLSKAQEVASAR
jgi:hypothetical protein